MYCNNNHLKLIDMKIYTMLCELRDERDYFVAIIHLSATSCSIRGAKITLKRKVSLINQALQKGYLWYNPDKIFCSEYKPLNK